MTKPSGKSCTFFKCTNQADVLVTFLGVGGLSASTYYLCSSHAAIYPFNVKEDISSEVNLQEVKNDV